MLKISREKMIEVCNESLSMSVACAKLGMHFNTFKRWAVKYGCYKPNQGLQGACKPKDENGESKFYLKDILDGQHPHYSTYKLKLRLVTEGLKENVCEVCGLGEWLDKPIEMELDHINGDRTDHRLKNLRMICPNCHSQTLTYRSKNKILNREIK